MGGQGQAWFPASKEQGQGLTEARGCWSPAPALQSPSIRGGLRPWGRRPTPGLDLPQSPPWALPCLQDLGHGRAAAGLSYLLPRPVVPAGQLFRQKGPWLSPTLGKQYMPVSCMCTQWGGVAVSVRTERGRAFRRLFNRTFRQGTGKFFSIAVTSEWCLPT